MNTDRADAIFDAALDVEEAERAAFVREQCGADTTLLAEVLALLRAHERTDGILEQRARDILANARVVDAPPRLGPYRLVREIGRGGMGVVYEAVRDDGQFRQRVAIKLIAGAADDATLAQRVLAERQILAALDHPSIARLLDGGVAADGRPYLVMEHVDGLPINTWCDRMRLGVEERLRLIIDVARAVDFAHRNLIVHRDLKPSNIFVTADGRVKLLDFGVAKLLNPALSGVATPTLHTGLALTPEYASPEQLRDEAITTGTDVYSLGVLLYELLTGERPHATGPGGLAELVSAVCNDDPERPSMRAAAAGAEAAASRDTTPARLAKRLSGDLDAIVLKALRKERPRRYGAAELLAQDIERHLADLPVEARQQSRRYAFGKMLLRHRGTAAVVAAAVAAVLLGAGAAVWQAGVARDQRDRAETALAQSQAVTDFMVGLFEGGGPDQTLGESVTAMDLVRRGGARVDDLAGQPRVQAALLGVLGRIYTTAAQYREAENMTQRAVDVRIAQEGETADAAALLVQLGIIMRHQGRYDSAQSLFLRARGIQERTLGPAHAQLGQTLHQLSSIAIYLGDLQLAEARAREALDLQTAALGETNRLTLNTLVLYASILRRRGLDAEAERMYRRAVALRPQATGSTRPEIFADRLSLADLLVASGRTDEAEEIYRSVYDAVRADDPAERPFEVWSRGGIAQLMEERGDLDGAERLARETLQQQIASYGTAHPSSAAAMNNVGRLVLKAGRVDEAAELLHAATATNVAILGADHPATLNGMQPLAQLYEARGELRQADSLMADLLSRRITLHGRYHNHVTEMFVYRARLQRMLGNFGMAEQLLGEALDIATADVSRSGEGQSRTHAEYAELYRAMGRAELAARHDSLSRAR